MIEQMAEKRHWAIKRAKMQPLVQGIVDTQDMVEMAKFDEPYKMNREDSMKIRKMFGMDEKGWANHETQWYGIREEYVSMDKIFGSCGDLIWSYQSGYLTIVSPTFVRLKDVGVMVEDTHNGKVIYRHAKEMGCTHIGQHFLYSLEIQPLYHMKTILQFKHTICEKMT